MIFALSIYLAGVCVALGPTIVRFQTDEVNSFWVKVPLFFACVIFSWLTVGIILGVLYESIAEENGKRKEDKP